jgi:hypothetical protein
MMSASQAALMRCKASSDPRHLDDPKPLSKNAQKFLSRAKEGVLERVSRIICSFLTSCLSFFQLIPTKIMHGFSWVRTKCSNCALRTQGLSKKVFNRAPKYKGLKKVVYENYPCKEKRLDLIVSKIMEFHKAGYVLSQCEVEHLNERGLTLIFKNRKKATDGQVLIVV